MKRLYHVVYAKEIVVKYLTSLATVVEFLMLLQRDL